MTEAQAYSTLVIILSITLAIFLILAIIATVYSIRLLKSANRISAKAESVADNIEQASENFSKVAGPAAAVQAAINLFKRK
jgi:hypothetical protein